ncbi:HAD family hydrolase [Cellulomonas hominis]|uniref:HAD family hydrolase n=1 Tax=Cellulomonas hominis TaxID=156981 RepID=UPI001B8E0F3D|nr:HAD family phosphatase [Cellulomonas hominis]VTR75612.1 Alpha-D-glucose 1-phosphate phosphatase YihX [Cellulomonas hominis]
MTDRPDSAVDAVVFDLGNVLVHWDPVLPFAGRLPDDAVRQFFADVDFPALNHRQDAGRPWSEARAEVAARHPEHAATLDLYVERFADSLPGPVPGSAAVVDDLRAAGVRVLGLTNWSAETFHHAVPAAPVIGRLEAVVVSGQEGVAKPDPRIFRLIAQRHRLDPARTLFTDDSPANVAAAAAEGFQAVLFTGAAELRTDLVARGALPATA